MQTTYRPSAYEDTVIDIMRKLPPERAMQLMDFARFLESQAEAYDEESTKENEDEIQASEKEWDRVLAKPEAQSALRKMAKEALEDYHAGRTTDITITDDGRLAPE